MLKLPKIVKYVKDTRKEYERYSSCTLQILTVVLVKDPVEDGVAATGDEDENLCDGVEADKDASAPDARTLRHLNNSKRNDLHHVIRYVTDGEDADENRNEAIGARVAPLPVPRRYSTQSIHFRFVGGGGDGTAGVGRHSGGHICSGFVRSARRSGRSRCRQGTQPSQQHHVEDCYGDEWN